VLITAASQRGMSLVEILISIAIVAMVLAMAAPSSLAWIQNLQLRNAAESALGGIKMARLEALRRNTTIAFELTDAASSAWRVCFYDLVSQSCSAAQAPIASRGASEGSPNARFGVETTFTDFAAPLDAGVGVPALVAFDSLGRVSSASPANIARIDTRNPTVDPAVERRLSILVGVAGQVVMCDPGLVKATNPQGCQ
jgi:type IV fimbrial biogenesis protein FimT